jgi:hypothetical protein
MLREKKMFAVLLVLAAAICLSGCSKDGYLESAWKMAAEGVPLDEAAILLQDRGFEPEEIAEALTDVYEAEPEEVVSSMLGAAIALDTIVPILFNQMDYSLETVMPVLAAALPGGDKTAESVILAATAVSAVLQMRTEDTTKFLVDAFGSTGTGEAFYTIYDYSATRVVRTFFEAGVAADFAAQALVSIGVENEALLSTLSSAEYHLDSVAYAILNTVNVPKYVLADWLLTGEFGGKELYRTFTNILGFTVTDLPELFREMGGFRTGMVELVKEFDVTGLAAGYIFRDAGFDFGDWAKVWQTAFGLSLEDVLTFLREAYQTTLSGALDLVGLAGFDLAEVRDLAGNIWGRLFGRGE